MFLKNVTTHRSRCHFDIIKSAKKAIMALKLGWHTL